MFKKLTVIGMCALMTTSSFAATYTSPKREVGRDYISGKETIVEQLLKDRTVNKSKKIKSKTKTKNAKYKIGKKKYNFSMKIPGSTYNSKDISNIYYYEDTFVFIEHIDTNQNNVHKEGVVVTAPSIPGYKISKPKVSVSTQQSEAKDDKTIKSKIFLNYESKTTNWKLKGISIKKSGKKITATYKYDYSGLYIEYNRVPEMEDVWEPNGKANCKLINAKFTQSYTVKYTYTKK